MYQAMESDNTIKDPTNVTNGTIKKPYPYHVFFILGNEFCERFAYYGMRAILVIYLLLWVKLSENESTAVYHVFIAICYISPLFGAILADGYIGRFWTIMYLSIVYVVGLIIMCLTALPPPFWLGPIIALLAIGIGTGGIKPCVNAFAGDQFSPEQATEISQFFSVFYFTINLGSLFSMVIIPLIRTNVYCFGTSCYSLAFSIPAILMLLAIVLFVIGRKRYTIIKTHENVIGKLAGCVWSAGKNWFRGPRSKEKRYLDHADPKYETSFIEDIRRVLHVAILFIPLIVYQALFDQQGSRWTLQAMLMDRQIGDSWHLPPEMMQVCNPLFCLLLIPFFELIIYPVLNYCKIPTRPLQRMTVGLIFVSLSFVMSGLLQLKIENSLSHKQSPTAVLHLVNSAPCTVEWSPWNVSQSTLQTSRIEHLKAGEYNISFLSHDLQCSNFGLSPLSSVSFLVTENSNNLAVAEDIKNAFMLSIIKQASPVTMDGGASVSFIGTGLLRNGEYMLSLKKLHHSRSSYIVNVTSLAYSSFTEIEADKYVMELMYGGKKFASINKELSVLEGGIYSLILSMTSIHSEVQTIQLLEGNPYQVSILLQIPQYLMITMGEILVSVTALSFAYSQAPVTMKSVVMSLWLMTTAVGNVLDALITGSGLFSNRAQEMFFFAIVMFITMLIFAILAYFYKYVNVELSELSEYDETTSLALSTSNKSVPEKSPMPDRT